MFQCQGHRILMLYSFLQHSELRIFIVTRKRLEMLYHNNMHTHHSLYDRKQNGVPFHTLYAHQGHNHPDLAAFFSKIKLKLKGATLWNHRNHKLSWTGFRKRILAVHLRWSQALGFPSIFPQEGDGQLNKGKLFVCFRPHPGTFWHYLIAIKKCEPIVI